MHSAEVMVNALKSFVKLRGHTYASLAKTIGLSESSVKRLFAENTFSLERFLEVCEVLQIGLPELALLVQEDQKKLPTQLTEEQEAELGSSRKLFAVFYLAMRNWKPAEMSERLSLTELEVTRLLLRLDKIGIIALQAENRYLLKLGKNFRLLKGGVLEKIYRDEVKRDFLKGDFEAAEEQELFLVGEISQDSWKNVLKKISALSNEIRVLIDADSVLPKNKTASVGVLFLAKPWTYAPIFGKSARN